MRSIDRDDMTRLDALRQLVALTDEHDPQRTTRVVYAEPDRAKVALPTLRRVPAWRRSAAG